MRFITIALSTALAVAAMAVSLEEDAAACGGCFVPPDEVTAVDSHRMVIALGTEETILWDQIVYSGNPAAFVWVLPVPSPEVTIELAENEFFDNLDRQTAPVIQPLTPPPFCASASSAECGGCGSAADAGYAPNSGMTDGVTVYDHDIVGPYETVVLGAQDPNALYTWLDTNGFAVTPDAVPAMEHYIGQQYDFVVMRLLPGQGVSAMQPVRVRYPGFMGTFPLKMVVVGAQGVLDMSLWVFAEQRYDAMNYGTLEIDTDLLSWDWDTNLSNYGELFDATVLLGGNRAWVAEFAGTASSADLSGSSDLGIIYDNIPVPYLTRLRTSVLVDNVDQDLVLAPSATTGDISNFLFAPVDLNYPDNPCGQTAGPNQGDGGLYCTMGMGSAKNAAFMGSVIFFGLLVVLRRRRRPVA